MNRLEQFMEQPLLMVIDMQNVYSAGQKWECHNFQGALDNILKLIESPRIKDVVLTSYIAATEPVGVWKDYNKENADVNNDSVACELVAELKDYADKYGCVEKSTYSALQNASAREACESASAVIVTGVVAECCVLSTVMELIDAGKYVIYVTDGVAGIDDATEQAVVKVLEGLSPLHLSIVDTSQLI